VHFLPFTIFNVRQIIQLLQSNLYFQLSNLLLLVRLVLCYRDCFWRSVFLIIVWHVPTVHRGNERLLIGGQHIFELFGVLLVHLNLPPLGLLVNIKDKVPFDVFLLVRLLIIIFGRNCEFLTGLMEFEVLALLLNSFLISSKLFELGGV